MKNTNQAATCGDAITANETVGYYLAQVIPAGSQVYWEAGSSIVPMLYAKDVLIYLPQINDGYSYHVGGNADTLLKFGRWNAELAQQWRDEADFILLDERHYDGAWPEYLRADTFDEITETVAAIPCRSASRIHIFRRIP
ncbi:MAG: hypothetical protein L3J16_01075 [Anaerolineales bacterium]|nr:hypothetical protein [Anaerolineales bacterium]